MMGWLVILHTCTTPYPQDTGSWKVMALFVPAAASKALSEIYLLWERIMRFLNTHLWKYESLRRTGSHLTATIWPTSLQDYPGMYFTCAFGTRLWAAKKKIFYSWALRFSLNSSNAVTKRGFHCAGSRRSFRLGPFVLFEQFCKAGLIYWILFEGPWLIQQFSNGELSLKPESWIGGRWCLSNIGVKKCSWVEIPQVVAREAWILLPAQWRSCCQSCSFGLPVHGMRKSCFCKTGVCCCARIL